MAKILFITFLALIASSSSNALRFQMLIPPLQEGQTVIFSGKTRPDADVFQISLASGNGNNNDHGDIQFVMSIRINIKRVVLNTHRLKRGWGREIIHHYEKPIGQSKNFEIRIKAMESEYIVYIDSKERYRFTYRLPLSDVRYVTVSQDIELVRRLDVV